MISASHHAPQLQLWIRGDPVEGAYALATAESLSHLPYYRVACAVHSHTHPGSRRGEPACIRVAGSDGVVRWLAGVITGGTCTQRLAGGVHRLTLWIRPRLVRLMLTRRNRIIRNQPLPTLVEAILREHGYRREHIHWQLTRATPVRPWTVQAGESDLVFIERLLARAGIWYMCEASDAGEEVIRFHDHASLTPQLERPPLALAASPVGDAHPPGALMLLGSWCAVDGALHVIDHDVAPDRRLNPASAISEPLRPTPRGGLGGELPDTTLPRGHLRSHGPQTLLTASIADLAPGLRLDIADGSDDGLHRLLIQSAMHLECASPGLGNTPRALTVEAQAAPLDAALELLPPREPPRPTLLPARIESHSCYGGPDSQGRYRVRAATDTNPEHAHADASPPLARLAPYGGKGRGQPAGWHQPLTDGATVVLSCLDNDPDQPVILGYLPSSEAPGPVSAANAPENRLLTPAGNALTFDDTRGARAITLNTPEGHTLLRLDAGDNNPLVRLAAELGGLRLRAGGTQRISVGRDLTTRIGADHNTHIGQHHHSRTDTGAIRQQAAADIRFTAGEKLSNIAGLDLQLSAGRALRLRTTGDCRVSLEGAFTTRVANGGLFIDVHGAIDIRGNGRGDMTVEQNGGGFTIHADGSVHLVGRRVTVRSTQGRTVIDGPLQLNVPDAASLRETAPKAPRSPVPVSRTTPPEDPGITALAWRTPDARIDPQRGALQPVARFTSRNLTSGEPVAVHISRQCGSQKTPLTTLERALPRGDGPCEIDFLLDPKLKLGAVPLIIAEQVHSDGLHFSLTARGKTTAQSAALQVRRDLRISLETTNGRHAVGAALRLEDADGRVHALTLRADGATIARDIPLGRLRLEGAWPHSREALAIIAVNDCPCLPDTSPWLVEKDPTTLVDHLRITVLPKALWINLRNEADHPALFDDAALDTLRAQGGNAVLFIHGYNTPHGEPGRGVRSVQRQRSGIGQMRGADTIGLSELTDAAASVYRTPESLRSAFPRDRNGRRWIDSLTPAESLDPAGPLNGTGARRWHLAMEHHLNRAAGFDGEDYTPWTRIVAVTWSGDTGLTYFYDGELAANLAGRRLLPVLRQLIDAGIRTTVITHSLGARVALTALNLLAELDAGRIEQLILWQPAVARNALTPAPGAEHFGHEHFPRAWQGAQRITVLHSHEDGILGGEGGEPEAEDVPPLERDSADYVAKDEILGRIGGIYPRKYGLNARLATHYAIGPSAPNDRGSRAARRALFEQHVWPRIEVEARALNTTHPEDLLSGAAPLPDLLLPWGMHARFDTQLLATIRERLLNAIDAGWLTSADVEPALGLAWDERAVVGNSDALREMVRTGRLTEVNQTGILRSHSGMRHPSERLFEEIYRDRIMRSIKRHAGFGKYGE